DPVVEGPVVVIKAEPPPPVVPAAPRIGEKVGFIQLPTRQVKPAERRDVRPADTHPNFPAPASRFPAQRPSPGNAPAPAPRAPAYAVAANAQVITLKPPIIVRELAEKINRKPFQVIADLMELGIFANVNQAIDEATAQKLCAKRGFKFEAKKRIKGEGQTQPKPEPEIKVVLDLPEDLLMRPPVVTIMGHVDHGKTSLLDVIRKADVAAGESGGITQHIGAYTISFPHPERKKEFQQITFLDTPGHAAFSAMRARGANVTDIVVLVVAANDGVMPQTLEALNHAVAAKAQILVAVNKCDHPNANPIRVRQQLQDHDLQCEEWGGKTIFVDCSAITKVGVDKLLESILLQAEVMELKANPKTIATGNVIESGLEPGGPTATVLVRRGTLKLGDVILCGEYYGKVRALINESGDRMKEAGPSVAARVLGLDGVPEAGIEFRVMEEETLAREEAETRRDATRLQNLENRGPSVTLENLFATIDAESSKTLKLIVKADTQGSVEAIVEALGKILSEKVIIEVIHSAVGTVTDSDVLLGAASKAIVLGFHTRVDKGVINTAKHHGVQIKQYKIIYELVDEVKLAMAGLLDPILKESTIGQAEVRDLFPLSKGGVVAGCVVASGRVSRGKVRVKRRQEVLFEGEILSLRRFKEDVDVVRTGMDCGIRLVGFDAFQTGDFIESFSVEKIAQQL
ncbi:MAG: translation initiation factor IF-2, partial [Pedosphaera sp.]|nr:translation initiation factor IF-2 [Pedosphaera sp.]